MNNHEIFTHDGKEFELRVTQIDEKYCVRIFLVDTLVSPTYSVDFETHADYFEQHQENLIDNLKSIAKSDIEQGMYFKA